MHYHAHAALAVHAIMQNRVDGVVEQNRVVGW